MEDPEVVKVLRADGSKVARSEVDLESGGVTLSDDLVQLALDEGDFRVENALTTEKGDVVFVDPEAVEVEGVETAVSTAEDAGGAKKRPRVGAAERRSVPIPGEVGGDRKRAKGQGVSKPTDGPKAKVASAGGSRPIGDGGAEEGVTPREESRQEPAEPDGWFRSFVGDLEVSEADRERARGGTRREVKAMGRKALVKAYYFFRQAEEEDDEAAQLEKTVRELEQENRALREEKEKLSLESEAAAKRCTGLQGQVKEKEAEVAVLKREKAQEEAGRQAAEEKLRVREQEWAAERAVVEQAAVAGYLKSPACRQRDHSLLGKELSRKIRLWSEAGWLDREKMAREVAAKTAKEKKDGEVAVSRPAEEGRAHQESEGPALE